MKLLIVQTGFLGDVILSTPVWANAQQVFPDCEVTVLTTPSGAELVRNHPAVKKAIVFDKRGKDSGFRGLMAVSRVLRDEKFDLVLTLHKSYRTALLLWLSRIPKRIGFQNAAFSFLYTSTTSRTRFRHDVHRNLAIFEAVGRQIGTLNDELSLPLSDESQKRAQEVLTPAQELPIIALAPGSVWLTKRWLPSGFAQIAKHFQAMGFGVVIVGGAGDEAVAREIETAAPGIINAVGKVDLLTSAALIARSALLVTNDSAPLHLASAVKTPIVAVFCATVPEMGFGPWQVPSEVVGVTDLPCRPCGRHGGNRCPEGTYACQRNVSAEMVISSCERVIARTCDRQNLEQLSHR